MDPFTAIIVGLVLLVGAFLIMPRAKAPKPAVEEPQAPTNSGGRPIAVLMGTKGIKGPNLIWTGEKSTQTRKVS